MECNTAQFGDKQVITDLLCNEKYMTSVYNSFCCECATPAVRNCLCELLADEHRMQEEIFCEMTSRGWYKTEKADDQKLQTARMQFAQNAKV